MASGPTAIYFNRLVVTRSDASHNEEHHQRNDAHDGPVGLATSVDEPGRVGLVRLNIHS
jgi:hypothetical protein